MANIMRVKQERCYFMYREPKKYARNKRIDGTIVGAYANNVHHPYLYSAYHIKTDDGRCMTILAKDVSIPGNMRRNGTIVGP